MNTAIATKTEYIPFHPAEQRVFRKRVKLNGADYAEKNIHVPVGSRQGLMRHRNNPPLYGIMEIASRPTTRVIVLGKGIQTGGTLAIYGLLLREGDYSRGGDNALIVMADERSVKKLSKKRLQLMIDKSPALAAIKSGNPDDTTIYSITLANGFTIDIGWASSEMSVSSESYRVVILDEISKYKVKGNIQDAKGRTTVYPDTKKIFVLSSPGLDSDDPQKRDPLMVEMELCDVIMQYEVKCPTCGQRHVMDWENFDWPKQQGLLPGSETADAKAIRRHKLAWYECPHCHDRWNDYKRDKAVLATMKDGWKPVDETITNPENIYLHYPSWLSPFMSLSEVVARWLEAEGDPEKEQKWYNLVAGQSYRHEKKERKEDHILRLIDYHMPRHVVPRGINSILIFADTQKMGYYYEVVAYDWGRELTNWVIDRGFVEEKAHLNLLRDRDWFDADGRLYRVRCGFIDSGGGADPNHPKHSRTREVYEFCIDNPFWHPLKGRQRQSTPVSWTRLDYLPGATGQKIAITGGLILYTLDTTYYKNALEMKLLIDHGNPGACHLHCGLTQEELEHWQGPHSVQQEGYDRWKDYAKQMCVEVKDERGLWSNPNRAANHHWDLGVYRYAGADILFLGDEKNPDEQIQEDQPTETKKTEYKQQPKARRW